jgi:hypothetical protein
MKTRLIKIGNSQGILINKSFLAHYCFENTVEIEPQPEGLSIKNTTTINLDKVSKRSSIRSYLKIPSLFPIFHRCFGLLVIYSGFATLADAGCFDFGYDFV